MRPDSLKRARAAAEGTPLPDLETDQSGPFDARDPGWQLPESLFPVEPVKPSSRVARAALKLIGLAMDEFEGDVDLILDAMVVANAFFVESHSFDHSPGTCGKSLEPEPPSEETTH